jgi:hypothetical protein
MEETGEGLKKVGEMEARGGEWSDKGKGNEGREGAL